MYEYNMLYFLLAFLSPDAALLKAEARAVARVFAAPMHSLSPHVLL